MHHKIPRMAVALAAEVGTGLEMEAFEETTAAEVPAVAPERLEPASALDPSQQAEHFAVALKAAEPEAAAAGEELPALPSQELTAPASYL